MKDEKYTINNWFIEEENESEGKFIKNQKFKHEKKKPLFLKCAKNVLMDAMLLLSSIAYPKNV